MIIFSIFVIIINILLLPGIVKDVNALAIVSSQPPSPSLISPLIVSLDIWVSRNTLLIYQSGMINHPFIDYDY